MFGRMSSAAARSHNTLIRRITEIVITIGAGATSASQAVTIDNVDNVVFFFGGYRLGAGAINSRSGWQPRVDWNATTVIAYTEDTSSGVERIVAGVLVEFMPFVIEKSYKSSITISANGGLQNSETPALGTWDLARTIPFWLGTTTTHAGQSTGISLAHIECTESTGKVVATRYTDSATVSCKTGYHLVQFSQGIINDDNGNAGVTIEGKFTIPTGDHAAADFLKTIPFDSGTLIDSIGTYKTDIGIPVFGGWIQGGFQTETPYCLMLPFSPVSSGSAERGGTSAFDTSTAVGYFISFGHRWVLDVLTGADDLIVPTGSASSLYIGGGDGFADYCPTYADGIISSLRDWRERFVWSWMGNRTNNVAANIDYFPTTLTMDSNTDLVVTRGASNVFHYSQASLAFVYFH